MPSNRPRPLRMQWHTKEERKLFPVWTLVVIALCGAIWFMGAQLYAERMAAYRAYAAISQAVNQDTFFPGITVDGTPLGGMTMEEAQSLFAGRQQQSDEAFSLVVQAGEKRWKITSQQVPLTHDAQSVLRRAYAVGRAGTLEERYAQIEALAAQGLALTTSFEYDREAVDELVAIIADSLDSEAVDAAMASFDLTNRTFTFTEGVAGYRVDREQLKSDILAALDARAYDRVITPQGESIPPQVMKADLEGRFGRVAAYSTKTTSDRDRNTNIEISAAALNGRMVAPGETMSFNESTGQRTYAKGYREAHAIAGGVLVDDTGGGVCQTSSTLFNAVVRADLEIVERYAHSWPSSYVNKGEDATVNWPSLDFVFRNNGDYPLFVVAWYEDQTVTVEIYGEMLEGGMTIDLESEVIETLKPSDEILYTVDESLPIGAQQAGRSKRTGYVVDTYKVYRDSAGEEIRREKLWRTTYRAMQKEILYHPRETAAQTDAQDE